MYFDYTHIIVYSYTHIRKMCIQILNSFEKMFGKCYFGGLGGLPGCIFDCETHSM